MSAKYIGLLWLCGLASSAYAGTGYRQQTVDGIHYGIMQAEPSHVSLHWKNSAQQPYQSLRRLLTTLEAQGENVQMLMNAGIFGKDRQPAGLWVERGQVLHSINTHAGKGNFHIQPNGVFWIQGKHAGIQTTAAYLKSKRHPDYALQSGPMLLINGQVNPRFVRHLSSPYKRNAVCLTKTQKLLFIMTEAYDDEWPAFDRFAQGLKTIGCYQALYLDGSLSDWYIPHISGTFHWQNFVGMIAVSTSNNRTTHHAQ